MLDNFLHKITWVAACNAIVWTELFRVSFYFALRVT